MRLACTSGPADSGPCLDESAGLLGCHFLCTIVQAGFEGT